MHPIIRATQFLASLGLFFTSCSTPRVPVDYENYARTPHSQCKKVAEDVMRAIPPVEELIYYGRWGGPGNLGGPPVDEMDECFRRHDLVYYLGHSAPILRESDHALVARLREIEPQTLKMRPRIFRKRAIRYFEMPISSVVGKPIPALFRRQEPEGSVFPDKESVHQFFDPAQPGMPRPR